MSTEMSCRLDLPTDSGGGASPGLGNTDGGRVGPGVLPHRVELGVLSGVGDERGALGEFTTMSMKRSDKVSNYSEGSCSTP